MHEESGLRMQLVLDEPGAFDGFMAHYGKFSGVRNYIVLAGEKSPDLDEKCGYYGEKSSALCTDAGIKYVLGRDDLQKGKRKSGGAA